MWAEHTVCGQNVQYVNVKLAVHILTAVRYIQYVNVKLAVHILTAVRYIQYMNVKLAVHIRTAEPLGIK